MYVMNEDVAARFGYAALLALVCFVLVWLMLHPPLSDDGIIKALVWFFALILSGSSLIISVIWALAYGIRAGVSGCGVRPLAPARFPSLLSAPLCVSPARAALVPHLRDGPTSPRLARRDPPGRSLRLVVARR
jgi:hypothetical protein